MNDILVIGSGQTGVRLTNLFVKENEIKYSLLFNTNDDEGDKDTIILNSENTDLGSGRNPLYTLNDILPNYSKKMEQAFNNIFNKKNIKKVILINSLSGGSGSAINYFIIKNFLLPLKKQKDIDIICFGVLPFRSEGNPANSNSLAMLNMYFGLTSKITFFPIDNDYLGHKWGKDYSKINPVILDSMRKIFDYDYLVSNQKKNGIGTLDKKEILRVLSPVGGFLCHYTMPYNMAYWTGVCNKFVLDDCKSMVVLIKTNKKTNNSLALLDTLNEKFPTQLKVYGEVLVEGENEIEIIANGVNIPESFEDEVIEVVENLEALKINRKEDKKRDKKRISKIGKKKLFKI